MVCARNSYFCPQQSSSCSITQEPPQLHEPQVLFFISLCDLPLLSCRGLRSVSTGFAVPLYFSSLRCFQISRYGLETKKKRKESLCGSSRLKQLKCINSAPGPPPCQLYSAVTELSWQSESRAQIFGFLSTAAWSSVSLRPVGFDLSGGGKSTQSGNDVTFPSPSRPISVRRGGTRAHTRRGQTHANTHATCTHTRHN